ncbi:MAG: hypothetical protein ACK5MP_07415 [Nostocoides sp.]
MAGFLMTLALTQSMWRSDVDWGLRYLASTVYVIAPLVAAVVAYDLAQRTRSGLLAVAPSAPRGGWVPWASAWAAWAAAVGASSVSWLAIVVLGARAGGFGWSDHWVVAETVAAYAAAAAVGVFFGGRGQGPALVAYAAGTVLLASTFIGSANVSLFQVAQSNGDLVGIERTPTRAAMAILCNLALVAAVALWTWTRQHQVRGGPTFRTAAICGLVVVVGLSAFWPYRDSEYRPVASSACASRSVDGATATVCGPDKLRTLTPDLAEAMAGALAHLSASGLDLPSRFAVARGESVTMLPDGTASLQYDPSTISKGTLPIGLVSATLAVPRPCAAFYSDVDSLPALELVDRVNTWLTTQLNSSAPSQAPDEVAAAYQRLNDCRRE